MVPKHKQLEENNIYSTEEQVVGKWLNGKPLYRKLIQTTTPTVATNGTDVWKQVFINDVDFGFLINIIMIWNKTNPSSIDIRNIFWQGGTNRIRSNFLVNKATNKGVIEIVSNDTTWNDKEVLAIVAYTKTTDSIATVGVDE